MIRRAITTVTLVLALVGIPAAHAVAIEKVNLNASFSPDRLGASTTVRFGFTIHSSTSRVPPAVTDVQLFLPAGMGLGTTDLGEATCNPRLLLELGPAEGCSPNSRMGLGTATVEIPTSDPVQVSANVTVYMTVPHEEHTTLLLYAETATPVEAAFVFPTQLLPTNGVYGAEMHTEMPLITSWPEGPPVSMIHMETSLGPSEITYYTRRHGKVVGYKPEGMAVPEHCPRGGFPFHAVYRFSDGSTAEATTRIPCPPSRATRHHKH